MELLGLAADDGGPRSVEDGDDAHVLAGGAKDEFVAGLHTAVEERAPIKLWGARRKSARFDKLLSGPTRYIAVTDANEAAA